MAATVCLGSPRVLRAHVRSLPEDSDVTISLILGSSVNKLQRPKEERLEKTLTRISLTLVKLQKKEMKMFDKKSKNIQSIPPPTVRLFDDDQKDEIPPDTPNVLAWKDGAWLHINSDVKYRVLVNPPTVRSLGMMSCVMVGSPVVPEAEVEFSDPLRTQWSWWRSSSNDGDLVDTELLEKSFLDSSLARPFSFDLHKIHTGRIYYPCVDDVGKSLLVQCTPVDGSGRCGHSRYFYTQEVAPEPDFGPIARRHLQTPCHLQSPDCLRVVSYNILADCYSTSDYAVQVLYPYCPESALQPEYRMGLIVREVVGYHSDIVCMQEVSLKCYEKYLLPAFREKGFDGHIAIKTGKVLEGEALFFNSSKYESVQTVRVGLSQFLQESPECRQLLQELTKAPSVLESVLKKHTIVQLTILKSRHHENRYVLVGNTHLCHRPNEDHIRLLQSIISINAFTRVLNEFRKTTLNEEPEVAVLFCGDFNSCPCSSGYEFLSKGRIDKAHKDWIQYKYSLIPRCGCCQVQPQEASFILNGTFAHSLDADDDNNDTEVLMKKRVLEELTSSGVNSPVPIVTDDFNGVDVINQFSLQDSCGPEAFTNYTVGFKGCLDYVFSDRTLLSVERVVPLPSLSELSANIALPSIVFPSDHLALVCDLKWRI